MKFLIIASLALVAMVGAAPSKEDWMVKKNEIREKLSAMTEEERQEEIQKMQIDRLAKFDKFHAKYESMTPEEREQLGNRIKAKLPAPVLEKISKLTDEQKQKIREKVEAFSGMNQEERLAVLEKIQRAKKSRGSAPKFNQIPEEGRQRMKERFESLSPEERQKLHDVHRQKFADGAVAYGAARQEMSAEDKQKIRDSFAKLTPEQRDEIRKQWHAGQRFPMAPRPAAASAVEENFQPIRSRDDDIMLRKVDRVRDMQANRRKPADRQ